MNTYRALYTSLLHIRNHTKTISKGIVLYCKNPVSCADDKGIVPGELLLLAPLLLAEMLLVRMLL